MSDFFTGVCFTLAAEFILFILFGIYGGHEK